MGLNVFLLQMMTDCNYCLGQFGFNNLTNGIFIFVDYLCVFHNIERNFNRGMDKNKNLIRWSTLYYTLYFIYE